VRDEKTVQIREEWLVPTVESDQALAFSPGRYRLCFEVASGGMATVYLALYSGTLGFERVVAVKTIHPHLAKEKHFIEMFLDEARIAAHIDHPFVCKVVDFGEAKQGYYLAMEYLMGEPLSAVWERMQERPAEAASPDVPFLVARIAADLAEGLHAAHELTNDGKPMGIVHRDVSPANLFVLHDGTVRVVDFGIAKAENQIHQTETGTLKGKYAYLAPEALSLKGVDRRSDLFSLGAVMWEMITGKRLFKRETPMDTMNAVAIAEVRPIGEHREHVPEELAAIVMRALERDPSKRFQTGREMADAIERFLGSRGRTVPKSEVALWLDDLFPGQYARKRQLVELTRRGETAIPLEDVTPAPLVQSAELTKVRPREEPEISAEVPTAREPERGPERATAPTPKVVINLPEVAREPPPRRISGVAIAALVAIAIGGGAGLAYYLSPPSDDRRTAERPTEPTMLENASMETPSMEAPSMETAVMTEPVDVDPTMVLEGEPGSLVVHVAEGRAEVFFQDQRVGFTGETLSLPPGHLRLEVRPATGDPVFVEVDIRSNRVVHTSVGLPVAPAPPN
jgi:serine/threonine-protein kinase